MLRAEDNSSLALLFHLNSQPWINDSTMPGAAYEVEYKEVTGKTEPVALPPVGESGVLELVRKRFSCRSYQLGNLSQTQLATLLHGAYGVLQLFQPVGKLSYFSRAVPSGGGLYPLEIYVIARSVVDLPPGLFHYDVRDHSLQLMRSANDQDEDRIGQIWPANACAIIIFTAVFRRMLKKYGARGYRFILLEAGHAAQNLCLLATEQGLGSLCVGGFRDTRLNRFLGLDGLVEAALYCVAIGYPAEPSPDAQGRWRDNLTF